MDMAVKEAQMKANRKGETWTPKVDEECADGCARGCWHDQNPKQAAKHTPGPWMFEQCGNGFTVATVQDEPMESKSICTTFLGNLHHRYTGPTDEANARLIAAAPELLEAAKDALAELDAMNPKARRQEEAGADFDVVWGGLAPLVLKLRAAIAKAEVR